jgi:hypothetical protein
MSSSIGHYQFRSVHNDKYSQPFEFFQNANKSNKLDQNNNELPKRILSCQKNLFL